MYKLAIVLCLLCFPAWATCPSTTTTPNTMAIQSPCVDTIVTQNQVTPNLTNVAISDANMNIPGRTMFPITVQAPGMKNVEVWTHGKMAARLLSDGVGGWTGTINTANEYEGPMLIGLFAWNSLPGDNSFTVHLAATFHVYVNSGKWYPFQKPPVQGLRRVFFDREGNPNGPAKLSALPCKPGTGVWPNCVKPTAADGALYYENKPDGGDFGNAAFEHTDSPYNPYTIFNANKGGGHLRIRSTYDPNYVDPYGFNRHWRAGLLSTAFPDGSSKLPHMNNGYYEARIMIPKGDAGWNTGASGGTWSSFWTLLRSAITDKTFGNVEYDINEEYGVDGSFVNANSHCYSPVTGPNQAIYRGQPLGVGRDALVWDYHRYGLLVTDTTVTAYFDGVAKGSLPKCVLPAGKTFDIFLMIDMDQGGGWPSNPPPGGYNDLWIDYVTAYIP